MYPQKNFPKHSTAVLVVDLQADFTEVAQGALPAQNTSAAYVQQAADTTLNFKQQGYLILATQDWHPADHFSFYTNHANKKPFTRIAAHGKEQTLWPPHCVQNTQGAELLLNADLFQAVIQKGTHKDYDSYSGFADDQGIPTGLHAVLQQAGITQLIIYGIAIEYCVLATALDALQLGYQVSVLKNLCRGVTAADSEKAWQQLMAAGVCLL